MDAASPSRLAAACLLALLAGCQPMMEADVTTFTALARHPEGERFVILPDKGQAGSLVFQADAGLVAGGLVSCGLRPAEEQGQAADLVALFHAGYAGSRTEYWYDPGTNWGGWGGVDDGTVYARTFYRQVLDVELYDGPAWRRGEHRMLFEGRTLAEGPIRSLNRSMPYLVAMLFAEFPGVNGQTVSVSLSLNGR